jgi:hypothetical protein
LDHLEAVFAASSAITKAKAVEVKNDPPRIIYSMKPSLLVWWMARPSSSLWKGTTNASSAPAPCCLNTNTNYELFLCGGLMRRAVHQAVGVALRSARH